MVILKHYKCPVYKTIKAKLFNIKSDSSVKDESIVFNIDELDKMLKLHRVKQYIPIECGKAKHIDTLSNEIQS